MVPVVGRRQDAVVEKGQDFLGARRREPDSDYAGVIDGGGAFSS
jgi:hypothetical protein